MLKYDLVNGLGRQRSAPRYLEICTPTTGVRFGYVEADIFVVRHRLMYRCPETFEDGLEITLRTAADTSHEMARALRALAAPDLLYDVIFVDSYHDYAASITDIHGAWCLLRPGGVLVIHDCNPTDPDTVTPSYRDGAWCGVTYQAFLDFVLAAELAGYCVVDCDYGCGVVFSAGCRLPDGLKLSRPGRDMVFDWSLARLADETRYAFFDRHRTRLLNLVAPWAFAEACGLPEPEPLPASDLPDLSRPADHSDPALRVIVAGQDVPLQAYRDGWHHFRLPENTQSVILASPSFLPSEFAPHSLDKRRLGLAVAGLKFDGCSINLADGRLTSGWHFDESVAGYPWRWTDGRAAIRLPRGTRTLDVFTTVRGSTAEAPKLTEAQDTSAHGETPVAVPT